MLDLCVFHKRACSTTPTYIGRSSIFRRNFPDSSAPGGYEKSSYSFTTPAENRKTRGTEGDPEKFGRLMRKVLLVRFSRIYFFFSLGIKDVGTLKKGKSSF